MSKLVAFRNQPQLVHLPCFDPISERQRLASVLDVPTEMIVANVEANSSTRWVLAQFQPCLARVENEDTEARGHFGIELERLMDIWASIAQMGFSAST